MALTFSTLFLAAVIALVHIFGHRLERLHLGSRRLWLSVSAGVTVAFVFLMLIPELEHLRAMINSSATGETFDDLVHVMTFAGVTIYYGLEHLAYKVRYGAIHDEHSDDGDEITHDYLFWLHIGWYVLYNLMLGILLLYSPHDSSGELALFGVAMGIHLLIIDANLRHHHLHIYHKTGRWLLAVAILSGWAIGVFAPLGLHLVALIAAFIIGGVFINGIKDELPPSRSTKFLPFLVGGVAFSVLAILL